MIYQLLLGCGVGAGVMFALGYWNYKRLERLEEKVIDAFIQEEHDRYVRIFELLLIGFEPESCFCISASSPVEDGVAVMQIILEEDDELIKLYARADGLAVTIIGHQEWASIAGYELVQAIPCVEDLESDDFWDNDGEEEFVD